MSQPPDLNSHRAPPPLPPGDGSRGQKFILGLVIGSAASLLVYLWFWHNVNNADQLTAIVLGGYVLAKLVAATAATATSKWRPLGAGLFASLAVGFLIFFGLCFSQIAKA